MNNNTLYTRCPTCSTAFKVTDNLLELAGGKVRCGACLAVFQATDYMLRPSVATKPTIEEKTQPQTEIQPTVSESDIPESKIDSASNSELESTAASDYSSPEDDSIDNEFDDLIDTTDEQPDIENNAQETLDFSDELESEEQFISESEADPEPDSVTDVETAPSSEMDSKNNDEDSLDRSLARAELALNAIETHDVDRPEPLEEFNYENETFDFNDEPSDFDKDFDHQTVEESSTEEEPLIEQESILEAESDAESEEFNLDSNAPEDDMAISIDEEIDTAEDPAIEVSEWDEEDDNFEELSEQNLDADYYEASSDQISNSTDEEFENHLDYPEDDFIEDDFEEDDFEESLADDQGDASEEDLDELSDQLHEQMQETDTDPDPLDEFDNIVKEEKKGIRSKIIIASIGALLFILIWQFWSNRQSLAWSDSWGSTVKAVCNYLPCNLKPKRDVSKIKLLQRQLSPDEEKENFLDIKILLVNEADFDQPYPTIKIAFSNKNGEQVSMKAFSPKDYLDANASSVLMPSGSEVHIHFKTEITHPDALGFEFIFE